MSITIEQAKALKRGDVLHDDFSHRRWRVNGQVKTWKRSPRRVRIPIKRGLWSYDYLTEAYLDAVHLESECPRKE